MGTPGMPVEERLGFHLKRVEQELMALKHAALRPTGLTVPQYSALLLLDGQEGISGAALARGCLVTPQTMSTILANLEAKGLIERSPHPWHRNVLETRLTDQGRQTLAVADAAATAIERRLRAAFSGEEREQLVALLARSTAIERRLRAAFSGEEREQLVALLARCSAELTGEKPMGEG